MSTKAEKQLIDAKIAKVREVVRNVSNNDIILALHNFDMDVNRTIHAFTNGDVDAALGDWEKNGISASKKNKQKKKRPKMLPQNHLPIPLLRLRLQSSRQLPHRVQRPLKKLRLMFLLLNRIAQLKVIR